MKGAYENGPDPVASRRRLRLELRREREARGITQADLARKLGWSVSKVTRIETGRSGMSVDDVHAVLRLLDITDPERVQHLVGLASWTRRRAWWRDYQGLIDRGFATYVGMEGEAREIYFYGLSVLPGVLQTPSYTRAVVNSPKANDRRPVDQRSVDMRTVMRSQRHKKLFAEPDPATLSFLLDEPLLQRQVGSREVMREQMRELLRIAAFPHVTLRIAPARAGIDLPLLGGFTILMFGKNDGLIYVEGWLGNQINDDPEMVQFFVATFLNGQAASLSTEESAKLIAELAGR